MSQIAVVIRVLWLNYFSSVGQAFEFFKDLPNAKNITRMERKRPKWMDTTTILLILFNMLLLVFMVTRVGIDSVTPYISIFMACFNISIFSFGMKFTENRYWLLWGGTYIPYKSIKSKDGGPAEKEDVIEALHWITENIPTQNFTAFDRAGVNELMRAVSDDHSWFRYLLKDDTPAIVFKFKSDAVKFKLFFC